MIDVPEPLWETTFCTTGKTCLVCANYFAFSVLRTVNEEVVPMCKDCSVRWNFHGYLILKEIRPWNLIKKLLWFKLKHPVKCSLISFFKDVRKLQSWAKKMKRWLK